MNDKTEQSVTDALVPATQQFQGRDGVWHNFVDDRHLQNTAEDGSWPMRNLYTQEAIDTLRAQLAEAQAAQTSNQYPPITTEIIYQHVQANQVRHFLRVSWKDGIDIEEPTHSVEYLLHAYADAAREGWASPEEVRTLRAAIDAAKGEKNGA